MMPSYEEEDTCHMRRRIHTNSGSDVEVKVNRGHDAVTALLIDEHVKRDLL
jgi:hypothetical protein